MTTQGKGSGKEERKDKKEEEKKEEKKDEREKPRALGRGLDALFPASPVATPTPPGAKTAVGVFRCPVDLITPQPGQPRQHFDDAALDELAASIREHGLLEPIIVRRSPADPNRFELIAGERRWRASQRAGQTEILVVVKDVSPSKAFELALVENIQRQDLNPVEFAEALDRLIREHKHTHEELAGILKKDRSTITNALRLLKLPARVRSLVIEGTISEGHARPLLGLPTEEAIVKAAEQIQRGKLSVRQAEALVREQRDKPAAGEESETPKPPKKSAAVRDVEARLLRRLGSKVELKDRGGAGEIVVSYSSLDELDRLLSIIEGDA